jgi:hypothetical protein
MCIAQDDEDNLIARYQEARKRAEQSNQLDLLEHFEAYVRANKTVCINMPAQVLRNLLSDPKVRYINLHNNREWAFRSNGTENRVKDLKFVF